ncbi:MAG: TonB-dependent receptor [Alphaproteobacteria bacterium]|nr:TonB-dependent receptor [Alphaproteobacteria bacterium]
MLNSKGSIAFKSALLAGAAMVAYSGVAANAQDKDEEKVEKVTVTGTRIKQRDFTSISPLATVNAKELEMTGTVNTEELLNTLPQIIPGVTISSNNPSLNGFATADLRGLGPGRTLILINGRRANPSDRSGAVDLNTIPANLIERIEVVSGGASAVYGADAVAGAINFILKDSYEGITVGGSYGQAEDGVAPYWQADALVGGKFDGDRGSINLGLSYYNRTPVSAGERDFSRYAAPVLRRNGVPFVSFNPADLTIAGTTVVASGGSATAPWSNTTSNGIGFTVGNIALATVSLANPAGLTLDADCNPTNGVGSTGGTIRFRTGGGIAPFQSCAFPNISNGSVDADGDRYNFAPDNFLILGNERVSAAAFAKYDILPDGVMTAFIDATFTNTRTTQQLAATPIGNGTPPITVQYDLNPVAGAGNVVLNPYVAAQPQLLHLAQLTFPGCVGPFPNPLSVDCLDGRTFNVNVRTTQVGNRTAEYETNALGSTQGLRGTIPSIDWDWEVFHSFARNTTTIFQNNNVSRTAMQQLYNNCNTTALAQPLPLSALPGCPYPTNPAPGQSFVATTTTNNPLGVFSLSQAMLNFVRIDATDVVAYERTMVGGNASGDVVDLWGEGAIAAAVGFEYRMESLDQRVDPSKSTGDIIGFNAAENIKGEFDVYEVYGEVEIPLVTGEALFENLSVVGGYRKSDYSTGAGLTETWKYGAEWSPFSWLTFRAIENHAVRAPSAFELFRNGDQNFPAYIDPCDKDTLTTTAAVCTAWFANFPPAAFVPPFDQPNNQVQSFAFGNPNLQPEIADTLTYGFVFNPDWFPLGRLGLSVDRYEIEVDNQIQSLGVNQTINECAAAIAANGNVYPVGNQFCDAVIRTAPGTITSLTLSLLNFQGVQLYSGVDVNVKWSWDMEEDVGIPGRFGISTLYTWVDSAAGAETFYGGGIGGFTAEDKAATSFTYDLEDWSFLLRWSFNGEVNGLNTNGFGVLAEQIPSYNLYDFGAAWNMTDDLTFSFGVENIFDEQPFIFPSAVNAGGQYNTDTSQYDPLGRQYRMGLRWKH